MSSKVYKLFGKTTILMTIVAMMMLSLFAGGQNTVIKAEEGQSREVEFPEHTMDTFSPQGTVINLFDYWVTAKDDPDNNDASSNVHLNSGINKDHVLVFKKTMRHWLTIIAEISPPTSGRAVMPRVTTLSKETWVKMVFRY